MIVAPQPDTVDALRPCSQLVYRETGPANAVPVVAIHGAGADAEQLLPCFEVLGQQCHVFAPQAARSCNPLLGGGNRWGAYGGYRWYLQTADERPEPATFGDSLLQLQCFLDEVVTTESTRRPLIVGFQQGGVLALTLALTVPAKVGGVLALDASVPDVPGWTLPAPRLDGMPIMIVADTVPGEALGVLDTANATVQIREVPIASSDPVIWSNLLREFLDGATKAI